MALHPSRVLLGLHCPRAEPGTVTDGGECESVPCTAVAPSDVPCPTGSVPGGCAAAGSVLASPGAEARAVVPPRVAGDGCSPPAARAAVPADTEGRRGRAVVPPRPAGPGPSQPCPGALGLSCGPESSAVPGGVPGEGSSSASVHGCPAASGVGACPVPAPRCGRSAGRGADTEPLGHSARCPRGLGRGGPGAAVPVRQRSPAEGPRDAQGSAALRVGPVPLPRAGQSRAQHSTSTRREGKERRAGPRASRNSTGHRPPSYR